MLRFFVYFSWKSFNSFLRKILNALLGPERNFNFQCFFLNTLYDDKTVENKEILFSAVCLQYLKSQQILIGLQNPSHLCNFDISSGGLFTYGTDISKLNVTILIQHGKKEQKYI